jgi:hypothetical protein
MVSSMTTPTLRQKVEQLAHELADAEALIKQQQRGSELGQSVYRAKNMAYGLLREMEERELKQMFNLRARTRVSHRIAQKLRLFFTV